jgi:Bacteriophage probable baseplate hub protein
MATEEIALKTRSFYVPRFEISIGEEKLSAVMSNSIQEVSVTEKINEGTSFSFTVNDEFDMVSQTFTWLDDELFTINNKVSIKMGYENELETMVTGEIKGLEPSFFSGESPDLEVTGQDIAYDFIKRLSDAKTFKAKSYSDIATEIAGEAGLTPVVEETPPNTENTQKMADTSYFSFLTRIAGLVGFQCSMKEGALYFISPKDEQEEILTLQLGKDLISFKPSLSTSQVVTEVEVRQHNPDDPENPNVGRAEAGDERSQEPGKTTAGQHAESTGGPVKKVIFACSGQQTDVADVAKAELDKANDGFITGEVQCIGIPQIRPGVCIRLEKVGTRFSGKYYVTGTTHTIGDSGYLTNFFVKRNAL